MLNIQEYLKNKTLDNLNEELSIHVTRHDSLPLAILNYDQIDSPKGHPIVRECRGLVLNTENNSLAARAFPRFFNWGEMADEMPLFRWDKACTQEKVDGSLTLFYFFDGEWRINTRGSFGMMPLFNEWQAQYHKLPQSFTWRQGVLAALGITDEKQLIGLLDPALTYVCEFCSLWNKVVREYRTPTVYLLTCFAGELEVGPRPCPLFKNVARYPLSTFDDVYNYVNEHPESDYEGCIVQDDLNQRWKIKNKRYLVKHKLRGNGTEMFNPKNQLVYILANDDGEFIATCPEAAQSYLATKAKVEDAYKEVEALWEQYKGIENQKEFALSIVGKTKFTGVLFNTRKHKDKLRNQWRLAENHILDTLF
jgi:hypothetical protein